MVKWYKINEKNKKTLGSLNNPEKILKSILDIDNAKHFGIKWNNLVQLIWFFRRVPFKVLTKPGANFRHFEWTVVIEMKP